MLHNATALCSIATSLRAGARVKAVPGYGRSAAVLGFSYRAVWFRQRSASSGIRSLDAMSVLSEIWLVKEWFLAVRCEGR